ncbi:MAG: heterodisulfide reductase subunit B, partial [Kordiimonadaceae bacterium]|nr:heterodisulfide reductase subunit B [Kordiimonadaceae bacterium]
SAVENLLDKMGIDQKAKMAEFEQYLEQVKAGNPEYLYDPRKMITSGPGFEKIEQNS